MRKKNYQHTLILRCAFPDCKRWHEQSCSSAASREKWEAHYKDNPWYCDHHQYLALGSEMSPTNLTYDHVASWTRRDYWEQAGKPGRQNGVVNAASPHVRFRAKSENFPQGTVIEVKTTVRITLPDNDDGNEADVDFAIQTHEIYGKDQ